MKSWKGLIVFLCATFAVAALGSLWPPDAWYQQLSKPFFNPPAWVFAPAWTLLYALMAVAAWRVYRAAGWGVALWLWTVQLALNAAWTPLFFGLRRIDLAMLDIVVLDLVVIATVGAFFRHDRVAGWMLIPYLAWIGFATLLTMTILRLNPV